MRRCPPGPAFTRNMIAPSLGRWLQSTWAWTSQRAVTFSRRSPNTCNVSVRGAYSVSSTSLCAFPPGTNSPNSRRAFFTLTLLEPQLTAVLVLALDHFQEPSRTDIHAYRGAEFAAEAIASCRPPLSPSHDWIHRPKHAHRDQNQRHRDHCPPFASLPGCDSDSGCCEPL